MKPLVSILIPAYNAERWVAATLRSALAQTWPRKEIILVDDGSTDRTLSIARTFETEGVRILRQENQGSAAARNKAASLCQGDYIQWLDADDLLAPDKVATQIDALDRCANGRVLASCGWGKFLYRPYRAKFVSSDLWCDLSPAEWLIRKMGRNLHMQTATWLISRELCEAAGPWDTTMYVDDDGEYFCRVLLASQGVRFVPDAKVYYRTLATASVSYIGRSSRKMDAQLRSMQSHIQCLLSLEDSTRTRAASVAYLQNWLGSFYPDRRDLAECAKQMATELGGQLTPPRLSWKYAWIRRMFGSDLAFRAQRRLPRLTWFVRRPWDKALLWVEGSRFRIGSAGTDSPAAKPLKARGVSCP
jgi:GT2 family glycosyltransferase